MAETNEPSKEQKEQVAYRRCLSVLQQNGMSREAAIAQLGEHPGKPSNVDVEKAKAAVAAAAPLKRAGAGTKQHVAQTGSKRKPQGEDAGTSRGAKLLVQSNPEDPAKAPTPGPAVSEEDMSAWQEGGTGDGQQ